MKLSVSLPSEDVAILDEYMHSAGLRSRSAALQHAVRMLRHPNLERDYAEAWQEWEESGEQAVWDSTLDDALR